MRKLLTATAGFLLLVPTAVFAGVRLGDYGQPCPPFLVCTGDSLDVVTAISLKIITGVSTFIGALAVIAFLYGAILMIVSRGDDKKEAGKKAMIYGGVGLALGILCSGILHYVCTILYTIGGGGGWLCAIW